MFGGMHPKAIKSRREKAFPACTTVELGSSLEMSGRERGFLANLILLVGDYRREAVYREEGKSSRIYSLYFIRHDVKAVNSRSVLDQSTLFFFQSRFCVLGPLIDNHGQFITYECTYSSKDPSARVRTLSSSKYTYVRIVKLSLAVPISKLK